MRWEMLCVGLWIDWEVGEAVLLSGGDRQGEVCWTAIYVEGPNSEILLTNGFNIIIPLKVGCSLLSL